MLKKIIYPFLSVVWMALIFSMSAKTAEVSGGESTFITEWLLRLFSVEPTQSMISICETVFRKLCHFGEYAVLSGLIYMTLRSFGLSYKKAAFSILICMFYAVTDEIHQYFVPGRACRTFDVFIDTLGSTFAYFVLNIKRILKTE